MEIRTMNKMMLRAVVFAGALAVPMAAAAQRPIVIGGGLVNVVVTDVIDDVTVTVQDINVNAGVAVNIAANVCGVAVGIIAEDLADGTAYCEAVTGDQTVTLTR
jgi:hypothetical protein